MSIDRITPFHEGNVTITVAVEEDTDSTPFEFECYSPEDIAAWRNDRWLYVGLVASVELDGVVIGEDSLWSIEDGTMSEQEVNALDLTGSCGDVIKEALYTARGWLTRNTGDAIMLNPADEWIEKVSKS